MIITVSPSHLSTYLWSLVLMTCDALFTITKWMSLEMWGVLIRFQFTQGHICVFNPFRLSWSKACRHESGISCWDLPLSSPPKICYAGIPVCNPGTGVPVNALVVEVSAVYMNIILQRSHFRVQQDMKVIQTPFLLWRKITRSWINNSYCSSLVHTNQQSVSNKHLIKN